MKTDDQIIDEARKRRLNEGLQSLAAWCLARASGEHDTDTTLTLLRRKTEGLRGKMMRAGWDAINAEKQ